MTGRCNRPRTSLLSAQGLYPRLLYASLARQIGEAASLAEFQHLRLARGPARAAARASWTHHRALGGQQECCPPSA